MENTKINKYIYLGLSSITILISGFFGYLYLSEWHKVQILKLTNNYSFGADHNPFFFKTAQMYSNVMLIFGVFFCSLILLTFWSTIKKKKEMTLLLTGLTVLAIIIAFTIGSIKG